MPSEIIPRREETFALGRLQPQNVSELYFFAEKVARSSLFPNADTPEKAFLLMSSGIELQLSPLQALRELNLINGRVDVPASVRAARIMASPLTTQWEVSSDETHCTIVAKRKDRTNSATVTIKLEDMSQADKNKHVTHIEDWLFARAVRRLSRQYFADLNLGIDATEDAAPDRVIDVPVIARIEQEVGLKESIGECEKCGQAAYLHPSRNGGVYAECGTCGHRQSPPQEVRDTVRGRMAEFSAEDNVTSEITPETPPMNENGDVEPVVSDRMTKAILITVASRADGKLPSPGDDAVLRNFGWDGKMRLAEHLKTLDVDSLVFLEQELSTVPA